MSSLSLTTSLFLPSLSSCRSLPSLQLFPQCIFEDHNLRHGSHVSSLNPSFQSKFSRYSSCKRKWLPGAATPNEGVASVINFEDFVEKDWSFLDSDELNTEQNKHQINNIISAGEIEGTSRVLVSIGSEGFVDHLVESSPCQMLLVVHDSLFLLALIKEKYDKVKCWQGELIHVPEKWAPLDVVFLYFLPALPFTLDQVFEALAKRCSPGARLVISHPQGRKVLTQQREQFPDVIVSNLPDKMTLEKVAETHSFKMKKFIDEPGLYLAVLNFCNPRS
ncbi:hypothetical protein SLE2022_138590 [Rubroshorea leprosula]